MGWGCSHCNERMGRKGRHLFPTLSFGDSSNRGHPWVKLEIQQQEGRGLRPPLSSVTSGPRRRWAKLCTVSSGSLPLGFINSLSPAQNRGLEKGGEGRRSPLHGGRLGEKKAPRFTFPAPGGYFHPSDPLWLGWLTGSKWKCRKDMGYYLRPEGRGCREPPTYRNLFWAAG